MSSAHHAFDISYKDTGRPCVARYQKIRDQSASNFLVVGYSSPYVGERSSPVSVEFSEESVSGQPAIMGHVSQQPVLTMVGLTRRSLEQIPASRKKENYASCKSTCTNQPTTTLVRSPPETTFIAEEQCLRPVDQKDKTQSKSEKQQGLVAKGLPQSMSLTLKERQVVLEPFHVSGLFHTEGPNLSACFQYFLPEALVSDLTGSNAI